MKAGFAITASLLALASSARGTYFTGFEAPDYTASPQGTILHGQQGWYAVNQGMSFKVSTYANNTLGFVQNPAGGNQFIHGTSGPVPARAQHAVGFTSSPWIVSYDMAPVYAGTGPAFPNLGSFSLNHTVLPATTFQGFVNVLNFNVPANPAGWRSHFNVFDAAGVAVNNQSPGAFWTNLQYNHWYRQYVTVDFAAHQVLTVTIVDLHTGLGATANPQGWYLTGGAASTLPLPDAIRFFTGGNAGNTTAWDNVHAIPGPAGAIALAAGGLLVTARRRRLGARGLSETEA